MRTIFTLIAIVFAVALTAAAQTKSGDGTVEVKVYLQKTVARPTQMTDDDVSMPVKRRVDADAPLQGGLEALFSERISAREKAAGFWSPTFGMKFEGVTLKNGTATVRFSQPPDKTNYGTYGPMLLTEAITKTARQFPAVKRVKICAVGDTLIDSQLERPFDRCR